MMQIFKFYIQFILNISIVILFFKNQYVYANYFMSIGNYFGIAHRSYKFKDMDFSSGTKFEFGKKILYFGHYYNLDIIGSLSENNFSFVENTSDRYIISKYQNSFISLGLKLEQSFLNNKFFNLVYFLYNYGIGFSSLNQTQHNIQNNIHLNIKASSIKGYINGFELGLKTKSINSVNLFISFLHFLYKSDHSHYHYTVKGSEFNLKGKFAFTNYNKSMLKNYNTQITSALLFGLNYNF